MHMRFDCRFFFTVACSHPSAEVSASNSLNKYLVPIQTSIRFSSDLEGRAILLEASNPQDGSYELRFNSPTRVLENSERVFVGLTMVNNTIVGRSDLLVGDDSEYLYECYNFRHSTGDVSGFEGMYPHRKPNTFVSCRIMRGGGIEVVFTVLPSSHTYTPEDRASIVDELQENPNDFESRFVVRYVAYDSMLNEELWKATEEHLGHTIVLMESSLCESEAQCLERFYHSKLIIPHTVNDEWEEVHD